MRYQPIPNRLFIENRKRFVAALPPGAIVVIHSNDIAHTNGDGTRSFIQNSDLFWLTGIEQEETVLILFPDSPVSNRRELLFVKPTNTQIAIWEGNKLSKERATEISGIHNVHWTSSFEGYLKRLMSESELVYLFSDDHPGRPPGPLSQNQRFAGWCRENYPLHQYQNAGPALHDLRMIKTPDEIELIKRACEITRHGFLIACRAVAPGKFEYEIEAEYAREFLRRGARGFAYQPIVASGEESCVLHYIVNDKRMEAGDVLLMDVGASYANYAADMTRTVPVTGKFSARQRAVYNGVLSVLRQATAIIKPGLKPAEYHALVGEMMDEILVDLGLLSMSDIKAQTPDNPARTKYFPHRSTHSLGIDVHDAGSIHREFSAGMVITCEPGIYVREEGFGIRLENDLLITQDGNIDLLADIPIEVDEVESLIYQS